MNRISKPALTVLFLCLFLIATMGRHFAYFVDLPSLAVVVAFPALYQLVLAGADGYRNLFAVIAGRSQQSENVAAARGFLNRHIAATWLFAVLAAAASTVAALGDLSNLQKVGPLIAALLLCPFYAAFVHLALLLPLGAALD